MSRNKRTDEPPVYNRLAALRADRGMTRQEVADAVGELTNMISGQARRELEEETGYAAGQLIALGWTFLLPAYSDECSYVYLAKKLTKKAQKLDPDEIIEVFQFSMQEIRDMIDQDEIVDALSILAIYRAMRYLEKTGGLP